MMTLGGPSYRYCDGQTRRSFLKLGGLAMGGLSLPGLLRAEQAAGIGRSHKAVIMVYLSGGISHQDTFDLKPEAPAEIRGEFNPIDTALPGVHFGELLPMLSRSADKLAVIRSIVGLRDEHTSWQNLTGYPMSQAQREGKPHFGSIVSRVQGVVDPVVPPFVDLFPTMQHRPYNSGGPGHLGLAYAGARLGDGDAALMTQTTVEPDRFDRRRALLDRFDDWRRDVDSQPVAGLDAFYQRAFNVLTSDTVARALDVTKEDPKVRDRYGIGSSKHLGDGAPMWNDQLLMARRLVESGARVVTVAYGFWDTHGNNFNHLRNHLPLFDQGISALVDDIYARGLDKDVTVVVWGEFGRTPKINKDAGRDHWAPVSNALISGGGLNVGQVIGSTDKHAAYAVASPIHYQDVLATVYHAMGIDPHAFVDDLAGRPIPILPSTARPIRRLI
ncbi:DUF1501 domain-containing protein [Tautonia rosea]|uniref:DUF1501 domain-containing protein n=1 Tax=Tautonia rosea TaxID=2728037 RepID=UPI001474B41F|nr:DUF1501 domain-containing protein [Tautonia rosea]